MRACFKPDMPLLECETAIRSTTFLEKSSIEVRFESTKLMELASFKRTTEALMLDSGASIGRTGLDERLQQTEVCMKADF